MDPAPKLWIVRHGETTWARLGRHTSYTDVPLTARVRAGKGDALAFAHGHVLRALTARWLGLPVLDGRLFELATATISVLGWEREQSVIERWNVAGEE